jgi:hypothetical protein
MYYSTKKTAANGNSKFAVHTAAVWKHIACHKKHPGTFFVVSVQVSGEQPSCDDANRGIRLLAPSIYAWPQPAPQKIDGERTSNSSISTC